MLSNFEGFGANFSCLLKKRVYLFGTCKVVMLKCKIILKALLFMHIELRDNLLRGLSLPRTRKGPRNLFEIERVRDRESKLSWNQWKGTEKIDRDRGKSEIEEGVRDRESPLYINYIIDFFIFFYFLFLFG